MLSVDVIKTLGLFSVEVAFETRETRVTALFGKSGAGKTSIINMIAGLVKPDKGSITVNGRTLFDSARRINLRPDARRLGYVFQEGRLFPHMSVKQNLTYGMRLTPPDRRYANPDQIVELLGIDHLLDRRPAKLSGGEKQRVAIGRSLLTSPELLLMDEPLASLDQARKREALPFIHALTEELKVPIVYVTHSVEEIRSVADSVVVLENGRVIAAGSSEQMGEHLESGMRIASRIKPRQEARIRPSAK